MTGLPAAPGQVMRLCELATELLDLPGTEDVAATSSLIGLGGASAAHRSQYRSDGYNCNDNYNCN